MFHGTCRRKQKSTLVPNQILKATQESVHLKTQEVVDCGRRNVGSFDRILPIRLTSPLRIYMLGCRPTQILFAGCDVAARHDIDLQFGVGCGHVASR